MVAVTLFSRLKSNLDPLGRRPRGVVLSGNRASRYVILFGIIFFFFLSISFLIIRFKRVTIRDRHSCVLHNDERNDAIRSSYYEFRSSLRFFFFFFFPRFVPRFSLFPAVKRCLQTLRQMLRILLDLEWRRV